MIKYPRCCIPFQNMVIDADGSVTPCPYIICDPELPQVMGNVNENSILDIWNGSNYRRLRAFLLSNAGQEGCRNCLNMKQNVMSLPAKPASDGVEDYEKMKAWENYLQFQDDIENKRTVMRAKPMIISYTESHRCNFRCIMCYQSHVRDTTLNNPETTNAELLEIAPYLTQLTAGGGEPFILPIWKDFLTNYNGEYPLLTFAVTTNGSYTDKQLVDGLLCFKRVFVNFSYDATYKELFERIRVHSNFEQVHKNLMYCIDLMKQYGIERIYTTASMTVMKENLANVVDMMKFMLENEVQVNFSGLVIYPLSQSLCSFQDPCTELESMQKTIDQILAFLDDPAMKADFVQPAIAQIRSFIDEIPFSLRDEKHFTVCGQVPRIYYDQMKLSYDVKLMQISFARVLKDGTFGKPHWYATVDEDGRFCAKLPVGVFASYVGQSNIGSLPTLNVMKVTVTEKGADIKVCKLYSESRRATVFDQAFYMLERAKQVYKEQGFGRMLELGFSKLKRMLKGS